MLLKLFRHQTLTYVHGPLELVEQACKTGNTREISSHIVPRVVMSNDYLVDLLF